MQALIFWAIAGLVVTLSLGLTLRPLWRGVGAAPGRARYDAQVFQEQLREIAADRSRGLLSPAEAAATEAEVARRLLAAAAAGASEPAAAPPPVAGHRLALGLFAAAAAGSLGLYAVLGAPGLPDQPQAERLARAAEARASRPDQASAEAAARASRPVPPVSATDAALIARLRGVLAERPDDLTGRRLLAQSLASLGQWPEARTAQADLVATAGDAATAQDLVDLAELGVMAAGGYVSPESETALVRAVELDPENPGARYYSALTLLQGGRPDLAHPILARLLAEGPADAPWTAPVRDALDEAARQTGLPPATPALPGPSTADIDAAADLSAEDRQAMVEGMVAQLGNRLATEGGPVEEWARLIRALGVLGRSDEAAAIGAEARATFAGDPAALDEIDAAAREAQP